MVFDLTVRKLPKDIDIIITNMLVPSLKPDVSYVYLEDTGSVEISIQHNLNKYPSVTFIDKGGEMVIGNAIYIDENNIKCTFDEEFIGRVILN